MFKTIAPVLVSFALTVTAAQAQFEKQLEATDTRDPAVMHGIENFMAASNDDHTLKKFRTGPKEDKPLGNYFQDPNFSFKSEYAKLSSDQQAKFAYDLNQYRKSAGLDWETIHKQPGDWRYMPYEKQSDFAQFYWLRNAPGFKDLGFAEKNQFIYESLIDATTIYRIYRRKLSTSADTAIYCDSAVQHVIKKEP